MKTDLEFGPSVGRVRRLSALDLILKKATQYLSTRIKATDPMTNLLPHPSDVKKLNVQYFSILYHRNTPCSFPECARVSQLILGKNNGAYVFVVFCGVFLPPPLRLVT